MGYPKHLQGDDFMKHRLFSTNLLSKLFLILILSIPPAALSFSDGDDRIQLDSAGSYDDKLTKPTKIDTSDESQSSDSIKTTKNLNSESTEMPSSSSNTPERDFPYDLRVAVLGGIISGLFVLFFTRRIWPRKADAKRDVAIFVIPVLTTTIPGPFDDILVLLGRILFGLAGASIFAYLSSKRGKNDKNKYQSSL